MTEQNRLEKAWRRALTTEVRRIEFKYLPLPESLPRVRRMSFILTTEQVLAKTKTVTRRAVKTWPHLAAGAKIVAIEQGQGLPAGRGHHVLALIEIVNVRVELLSTMTDDECTREGFPGVFAREFVEFFLGASRDRADAAALADLGRQRLDLVKRMQKAGPWLT